MKIGAVYPQIELGGDPDALRRFAAAIEELGYDHLMAYDHVLGAVHADREPAITGAYDENDPFHDPFVMFAHLAALTRRLEFVTGVLVLPQRQTALVARQAADVDLFSGGRLRLGVGIGWSPVEYEALGQDFRTRGVRQEEQIGVLRHLFADPVVDFSGFFDRIDRAALNPKPTRQIPIWIGGGEAAYDRAARIADGFIFIRGTTDDIIESWNRLGDMVEAHGRVRTSCGGDYVLRPSPTTTLDEIADVGRRWRSAGGTHLSVATMDLGFDTVEKHIDYLALVAGSLDLTAV